MAPRSELVAGLFANRALAWSVIGLMAAIAATNALLLANPEWNRLRGITDFQDFYVVGKLALSDRASCGYDWPCLRQAQIDEFGQWEYMPWAYPPQFTGLMAALATVSHPVSFALFSVGTFALYAATVWRLSEGYAGFPLALTIPAAIVNMRCGQNGFLTGALLALFALLCLQRRRSCGAALGAMVIKPHLAAAAALFLMIRRRYAAAAVALAVVAGSAGLATLQLGSDIWPAFARASEQSGRMLWDGKFPLERMVSVYAMLRQAGVPAQIAMGAQLAVAFAVVSAVVALALRCRDERLVLAGVMASSVLLSPYTYDYDLPIIGVALALIAPVVVNRLSGPEALAAGLLSWISASNFLLIYLAFEFVPGLESHKQVWSVSAACLVGLGLILARAVRRGGPTLPQRHDHQRADQRQQVGAERQGDGARP